MSLSTATFTVLDTITSLRITRTGIGKNRSFSRPGRRGSQYDWNPPAILDILDLGRALTGKHHSLLSLGKTLGCEVTKYKEREVHDPEVKYRGPDLLAYLQHYVEYMFNDVDAAAACYEVLMTRFLRHPVNMPPESLVSMATLLKRYLRVMGMHPPLCPCASCKRTQRGAHNVPAWLHGLCKVSYYGGRSECRTRLLPAYGSLGDVKSAYPLQIILNRTWEMKVGELVEWREATGDIQQWLDALASKGLDGALDYLRQPHNWPAMVGIAEFHADGRQLLPVRAEYGVSANGTGASGIGINYPKQSPGDVPCCYAIADIAASVVSSLANGGDGSVPKIERAFLFWASEEKQKQEMVNGGLYGVDAEENTQARDPKRPTKGTVWGMGGHSLEVKNPPELGEWALPVAATVVTAGERLLLTMIETELMKLGVRHQFMDTDSIFMPNVTHEQYLSVVRKFDSLNLYDHDLIPHLVELQQPEENEDGTIQPPVINITVSAKNYCIYRLDDDDKPVIVKRTEHGYGQYRDPYKLEPSFRREEGTDWISEAWLYSLRKHVLKEDDVPEPPWLDMPAVSYFPVSSQHVMNAFTDFNAGKPMLDQVRPGNFYMGAHRDIGSRFADHASAMPNISMTTLKASRVRTGHGVSCTQRLSYRNTTRAFQKREDHSATIKPNLKAPMT